MSLATSLDAAPSEVARSHWARLSDAHIAIALALSLLVHVAVLIRSNDLTVFLFPQEEAPAPPRLEVTVAQPQAQQIPQAQQERSEHLERAEPGASNAENTANLALPEKAPEADNLTVSDGITNSSEAALTSKTTRSTGKATVLITTLPSGELNDAQGEACDPSQQATSVRRCKRGNADGDFASGSGRFEGAFSEAFAHLNTSAGFREDMAHIERMLMKQAELDTLEERGVTDARLVAQHRQYLRDEINRLDAIYENNNLTALIVTSGLFTKELTKVLAEKLD
ncbi:MAG: hypothetical protein AAGI11_08085 [Pseudomonadota bacterium]